MTNITISEYGYIGCDNVATSEKKFISKRDLGQEEFQELYDFWHKDKETQKVFSFENQSCLKAQNYVGVIQTPNLSIEILPKIYDGEKKDETRTVFIEMLKVVLNINEVQINKADLSVTKNKNIYEMFISMFVNSIDTLIHKGLKSEYIAQESNQYFLKGKLKFGEHIKQNYIHKERFYVEFDEYLPNRVENKLLKSTINLLLKKTTDYENKKALRQQLFIFDEVSLSHNHRTDISKINLHRGMEYYELPLRFAKVFLEHNSFSSLRGKDNVFALLFPMEKLFEEYMERVLKNSQKELGIKEVLVNGGKNEYLLGEGECQMARLQPDYLLKMLNTKDIIVDAKWKLLELNENETKGCSTINISAGDVYQIFSYLHFYDAQSTAYLFVPNFEIKELKTLHYQQQSKETPSDKKIKIIPIDLVKIIANNHIFYSSLSF
jgi:5-methylcytosine-specific restriction enzyme subunit McrC